MMVIHGKLTSARKGYAGHTIELIASFLFEEVDEPLPLRLIAEASDDGLFEVELPHGREPEKAAEIIVRAPDGRRLARELVDLADDNIAIKVRPQMPVEIRSESSPLDPAHGTFLLRVSVHDSKTNVPAGGEMVSVWGRLKESPAGAPDRTIVAADYTDTAGIAKLSFARAQYTLLEVQLPGAEGRIVVTPITLDEFGVPPAEIRMIASFPQEDEKGGVKGKSSGIDSDDEACNCATEETPRTPSHSELTGESGLYATDLADGTCPSPAVANRTLEEYRYYSLIRTTDPYLFGVKPKPSTVINQAALDALAGLAWGFGTMDSALAEQPDGQGGNVTGERPTAEKDLALDQARFASDRYIASGLLTARAWREAARADDVRAAIVDRAASLSEDTLRHALADPDGFTPVSLMTAERLSAAARVKEQLAFFHDRSKGRELVDVDNMPQWDATKKTYQASTVAHGHILEWRQVWRADGYSLGDLLYSMPLAPGQKRKVAVVDWDRDERGFRVESRAFAESFNADLVRNRTVNEVVNSTVNESIRAGSSANTWGAGGGLGLGVPFAGGFFGLGVAGGGGGASSTAWQNSSRSLAATSGQQLSDRTSQAAAAVRSQRATVVVGTQQSEGLSITSEVVANYNHCHSMTMEYFEVLQHFRVDQELASVRECLFIPLEMRSFDIFKALRWRDILQRRLRRPRIARGFGAMERMLLGYADNDVPPGRYADEVIRDLSGEIRVELTIARPRGARDDEDIDEYLDSAWNFWIDFFGIDSARAAYDATIEDRELADHIFASEHAPRVARAFCDRLRATLLVIDAAGNVRDEALNADFTMVSNYRPGGLHLVTFRATRVPANVTRASIVGIRFDSDLSDLSPNSNTLLRMANVSYSNDYRSHRLVPRRWLRNDLLDGDGALVKTRSLGRGEERNPREEDRESIVALLRHLNEFVEHYHHVIWWRMDPNRRFMLLDGFIAPNSNGRSLASVVENRLISIVGNALVMPVVPGYQLVTAIRDAEENELDLLDLYRPAIPIPPRRISLPTRGVHAEAILGACNSCEIRDDTRFWDWASETIPGNEPPPIEEISTTSRRQDPTDTTPTALPNPVVAIQNAPAAPEPASISSLGGLLTTENLFKDVTGLEENQKNALAAFQQSLKTANAFGKMAAGGAKSAFANRNSDRVLRKVQEAEASGLLSKDDAKTVTGKLFGVINGDDGESDEPLNKDKVIEKSIQAVNESTGKKKLTVTSESGSSKQAVETETENSAGATAPTISYHIHDIPPLKQPSPETCWAVALTMLVSHNRQQSLPIETVLLQGGEQYVSLFRAGAPLAIDRVVQFRKDFDLKDVSFGALSASAIEGSLKQHGPLWVIGDENAGPAFSIHARVVTGIVGDGTPGGTRLVFNDPATGTEEEEALRIFAEKIEQLSQGARAAFGGVSPTVLAL